LRVALRICHFAMVKAKSNASRDSKGNRAKAAGLKFSNLSVVVIMITFCVDTNQPS
jgi:hypothetical protein